MIVYNNIKRTFLRFMRPHGTKSASFNTPYPSKKPTRYSCNSRNSFTKRSFITPHSTILPALHKNHTNFIHYKILRDADGLETLLVDPELLLPIPKHQCFLIKSPPLLAPPTNPPTSRNPLNPTQAPHKRHHPQPKNI